MGIVFVPARRRGFPNRGVRMDDVGDRNRRLAQRWFQEVWNEQRAETIDELMSPDFIGRLEGWPVATRESFYEHHERLLEAIPDFHVEIEEIVVDGSTVVIRWRFTGNHTGTGFGIPPSGKEVNVVGVAWMVWRDGQIVEGWDSWNMGEFLVRLANIRVGEIQERHGLTRRQAEVALRMAGRRTHKEIARGLDIRPNTARRHCQDVLRRLGVHRREDVATVLASAVDKSGSQERHPAFPDTESARP